MRKYISKKNECLDAFLILISTNSASEFNKAYKTITGAGGLSIIYYLNKKGEKIK